MYVIPKLIMIGNFLNNKTKEKIFEGLVKGQFKWWMMLPKTTSTELIEILLGTNAKRMADFVATLS